MRHENVADVRLLVTGTVAFRRRKEASPWRTTRQRRSERRRTPSVLAGGLTIIPGPLQNPLLSTEVSS
jgi:hypothetical protein